MTVTELPSHSKKILIFGDLLIDSTYYVKVTKISPESPVPVAELLSGFPQETPGGAGLGAIYATKQKIKNQFVTACSKDSLDLLLSMQISPIYFFVDKNVTKQRYIDVNSGYHLLRVDGDRIADKPNWDDDSIFNSFIKMIKQEIHLEEIGCFLFLDYRKGFFNEKIAQKLIGLAKENNIPISVDTRRKEIDIFRGATVLKLNDKEFAEAKVNYPSIKDYASMLYLFGLDYFLCSHAGEGASILKRGEGVAIHISPNTRKSGAPDVTGCGDVLDIQMCYNMFIKGENHDTALKEAVNKATEYAYDSPQTRLLIGD
jgi:bifunctional ADP-heptose synthase (sugar kinase/adenylyltransferase)